MNRIAGRIALLAYVLGGMVLSGVHRQSHCVPCTALSCSSSLDSCGASPNHLLHSDSLHKSASKSGECSSKSSIAGVSNKCSGNASSAERVVAEGDGCSNPHGALTNSWPTSDGCSDLCTLCLFSISAKLPPQTDDPLQQAELPQFYQPFSSDRLLLDVDHSIAAPRGPPTPTSLDP